MAVKRASKRAGRTQVNNASPVLSDSTQADTGGVLDRVNKKLESAQFFASTREYAPREGTCYYVYRLWPVIDRALGPNGEGATKYIAKLSEPIDEDYLLRHFGSGDYGVHFTDSHKPRGATQIARTIVRLRSEEFAPVLDVAELVIGDPHNKAFIEGLRARGVEVGGDGEESMSAANTELARVASEVIRTGMKPAAAGPPTQALDIVADAAKQAMAMNNPANMLQMIAALKELGGGGGQMELFKLLLDQQARQTDMLVKTLESLKPATPAGSLGSTLEELVRVKGMLDKLDGGGRRGNPSWVSELVSAAPDIAQAIGSVTQGWAMMRMQTPAAASPRVRTPAPLPVIEPAAAPVETVAPVAVDSPTAAPVELPDEMVTQVSQQILQAIESGRPGDAFAESVCTFYGDAAYDFVRQVGTEQIIRELQARAELWVSFAPIEAELRKFLGEFMAYGDEEETGAEGADVQPEGAAK